MIGVIGGTGLNTFQQGSKLENRTTPYGEVSAVITQQIIGERSVFFLARHGSPHRIPPHKINYRANLWALKQLGVTQVIAVNAVGGITPPMQAGALVLPDQIVDYTYGREHTFFDGSDDKLDHVDFSYPFSEKLREILLTAASELNTPLIDRGVYAATQGPRLESAAEVDRLERDGCDIVGMTAMPEAALARELALEYTSLCLVVNPAAGRSDKLITMEDIQVVLDSGMNSVRELLSKAIQYI